MCSLYHNIQFYVHMFCANVQYLKKSGTFHCFTRTPDAWRWCPPELPHPSNKPPPESPRDPSLICSRKKTLVLYGSIYMKHIKGF